MSNEFTVAETDGFRKEITKRKFERIYKKITSFVYPQLRKNPRFGPNIKRLKGKYEDFYRFRIGDYRLFYAVDNEKVIVFVVSLRSRGDTYK